MDGFSTMNVTMNVNGDVDETTSAAHILTTPTFSGWRLILTWATVPKDLDAYTKTPEGDVVFYNNRASSSGKANLDTDAKLGFGPETITITATTGNFSFYVKNYSNEVPLRRSNAKVQVLKDGNMLAELIVPKIGNAERVWNVLTINTDNGTFSLINKMQDSDP